MRKKFAQVVLDVPVDSRFDYTFGGIDQCPVGVRVEVPFGRQKRCGVVVGISRDSGVNSERLRAIRTVLDPAPLLDLEHFAFLKWAADYYHHPLGEVVMGALPVRLRRGKQPVPQGEPGFRLTGDGVAADLSALKRAPRQMAVMRALLGTAAARISRDDLNGLVGPGMAAIRTLRRRGWVEACRIDLRREVARPVASPPVPTAEQAAAITAITASMGSFTTLVLQGVTGSGKTEVYLRAVESVLAQGFTALILVPEISLTPQLVERFRHRFGAGVVVQHSGLNERERELAWQAARLGKAKVVVGTRSAVLNPIADLGLIVVDEEHDPSFKQQDGFRYSARDLALVRAQRAGGGTGCPVVLGSATPAFETLRNVREGRYRHLVLRERAGGARLPKLELLDVRDQPTVGGMSPVLLRHLDATVGKGEQALVFLNRRGFAPVLTCYACGWVSDCPRCDARQTYHSRLAVLWCHHCGAQRRAPVACPACGAGDLKPLGQGTEQLEQVLAGRFPDTPLLRVDRDATRRKGSLNRLLAAAHTGKPAILIGTQMLAKGHDFPKVTLVGVLDVDGGLFGADYRSPERTAQLILQVAGRAGRGAAAGRVLIQTRYPEHPLLQLLVSEGYDAFANRALAERQDAELPPYSHQVLIRAEAVKSELPPRFLEAVKAACGGAGMVEVWGPVPAPMERKAGRFRAHLLLQAGRRAALHRLLTQLLPTIGKLPGARQVRWSLDVDPIDLM